MSSFTQGSNTYTITYNDEGIRTSKTVNGVKHTYTLDGSRIVSEQWSNKLIIYLYDETGSPIGMQYRTSSYAQGVFDTYYFEKNLQGDVIAIYNASGTKLVSYIYDAWGNCTTTYYNSGASTGIQYNPFRYRGYYYDADLGFYYLNSRYYDPNIGRFINADDQLNGGILGYNTFAYCLNNPISGYDPCGNCFHRWDFWNDCADCAGKNIGEKIYNAWSSFVEEMKIISESVYCDIGVGTGFGASTSLNDVDLTMVFAREDFVTIKKDAGSSIEVGKTIEQCFGFSAMGCDMSKGYTTFVNGDNQSITEPINPEFDLKQGVSIKMYAIIGFTIEFGIDIEYILDSLMH